MYLTTENAAEYVGKTLDLKRRTFGFYPITVTRFPNGEYCVQHTQSGTFIPVPAPSDTFNAIPFDIVDGVESPAWDGTNFYGFRNPPGVDKEPPEWMGELKCDIFQRFKRYAVEADSLRDFCERYHLPGKVENKEADYQTHKEDLLHDGFTLIPPGSSSLTSWAAYYGPVGE